MFGLSFSPEIVKFLFFTVFLFNYRLLNEVKILIKMIWPGLGLHSDIYSVFWLLLLYGI